MATYVPAKVSTTFVFYASLVSQANTKLMQVNPTIASGDFKVSIDGGALANLATLPTVTPAGGSMVKFTLSTSEMAGANATVVCIDAAGAEWCDLTINIQTAARQIDDLAYPATTGRSMVVDVNGLVDANMVKAGATGAGTAQTARDLGASVLVGGYVAGQDLALRRGTAQAGTTATIQLDAGANGSDNFYSGAIVGILSGTGVGQHRIIASYTGVTKTATVERNFVTAPDNTSLFVIMPGEANVETWARNAVFAATGGVPDINVKFINTVLTSAVTTVKAVQGLTTADTIATYTGNTKQTGDVYPLVDTEIAAILAAVDTEVAAILALLNDPRAEPTQGAPPVNGNLAAKLDYLYKWARNRKTNDGTTTKFYADDESTVDHKQTTSESAGTVTVTEIVTGP